MTQAETPSNVVRVTADTNVFYYLGTGATSKEAVISDGEVLWATPLNVLEIVAGIGISAWEVRRDAARGILSTADHMSLDPEQHLAAVIDGLNTDVPKHEDGELWLHGCKAIAEASSEAELESGVKDYVEMVMRRVNVKVADATKSTHYECFVSDIIDVCEMQIPGYRAAVSAGLQAPVVDRGKRIDLRKLFESKEFLATTLVGVGQRYKLVKGNSPDLEDDNTVRSIMNLEPYCRVYGAYLRNLLTARWKPQANDWGDLELFMYLQPGAFVATAEKRWWRIAETAGLDSRVRKVQPK